MPLPISPELTKHECYKPVVSLLQDRLVPPRALAERWSYTEDHLSNLRRANHGLPWIRLPLGPKGTKGGIRYRLSDIVAAEIDGNFGQVTLSQVEIAVASCPALTLDLRAAVQAHLRTALGLGADADATGMRPPQGRRGRPRKPR